MASEGNKGVPNEALSIEQSSTSGAKRKRGRPRKYEYPVYDVLQKAQPIQSIPPLRCTQDGLSIRQDGLQASHSDSVHGNRPGRPRNSANMMKNSDNQASYQSSAPLAIPVSVSPSNPEMRTLAKQDTELVIPKSSVAAVPIKSACPVLVPCKQVDNQNELAGKKSVNEFQKDSESSNETKDSSGQTQNVDARMTDEIKIKSGTTLDSANSEQQNSKEPSDITEQSEQLKTETGVLKGVDDLKSGTSDDVRPAHDEHEMKADSK
ncbi:unnamed protein product [Urochloa decumbens]|uniref:Uncharacterized protein n=1 Tax=Urochloa decumbens TaxID=240449 RepID=A0ABC9EUS3_9POAL